jgi:hypothetical protein
MECRNVKGWDVRDVKGWDVENVGDVTWQEV